METRLTTLEERYARLEHEHRELSDAVWEQTRLVSRLEARVAELEQRLRQAADGDGPIPDEPPPHY